MRRWLITGVSSGLGAALAEAALAHGDAVAGTARSTGALERFAAHANGRAHAFALDLNDTAAIGRVAAQAEGALGGIDVLVNNAGYGLVGAVEEAADEEVRAQFQVNFFAPLALLRAVLPGMRARRAGHLVNITSVSGLAAWAGTGVYCASKFALEAIGRTLAQEVAGLGIRVTNVAPGGMRTDYAGRSLVETRRRVADYEPTARQSRRILAEHAGQEAGDPARVAAAILAALDVPDPPLHLILGADALHYAERESVALQADIARWREASLATAFEAG